MKRTRLEKFLINRGLLEAFLYNMEHHRTKKTSFQRLLSLYDERDLIQAAFIWMKTDQRLALWDEMDEEWRWCLEHDTL